MTGLHQTLTGFSLRPRTTSMVFRPEHAGEVEALVAGRHEGGILARGSGTSYGDAGLNGGGAVLDLLRLDRFLVFDETSGLLTCEAGATLRRIIETFVPRGWFLSVTPGTWKSTVGGCLACDVHGKNHHVVGSFGRHVERFTLALASGEVVECSREANPELFWATIGGLGCTGVLLSVTLRLQRIATARMQVRHLKTPNLEKTFEALARDESEPYSVAWFDVLAQGRNLGRGVIMLGRHAPTAVGGEGPLRLPGSRSIRLPFGLPSGAMSPLLARAFNALYYRRYSGHGRPVDQRLLSYFYPLEAIDNFNRLYGSRGLVEYQVVLPPATAFDGTRAIVETLSSRGYGSFLAVMKRMGEATPAPMSFPLAGYTFAVDIPVRDGELFRVLRALDERVVGWGGRVYLAKDSRLGPDMVDVMYPRRREWARTCDRYDPERRFMSSLARRLRLRD